MMDPLGHDPNDAKGAKVPAGETAPSLPEAAAIPMPSSYDTELGWGPRPVPAASPAPSSIVRPLPRQPKPSAFQRALGAARAVLPVVQKILPLLDGNIALAAANLMSPQHHAVDLEPVKTAIGKLQTDLRVLRGQVSDNTASLQTLEEDLATLKNSLERNSLEQRELLESMLSFKKRINRLAWMLLVMVILSIAFTALISVRLAYLLRL